MHNKVTLGTKNNLKIGDGRIGLRRFWAPFVRTNANWPWH